MLYISSSTGRGPLCDDWLEVYCDDCEGKDQPTASGRSIMCAYKLCKVEFRYWGMQSKIERWFSNNSFLNEKTRRSNQFTPLFRNRFIHDVALRKTMLKAHLQAWVWQDEWHGLTMEVRRAIRILFSAPAAKKERQAVVAFFSLGCFPPPSRSIKCIHTRGWPG